MRVGLYFSLPDWSKPAFFKGPDRNRKGWQDFIAFTHAQVRELLTNYGKIDLLWYDNILGQSGKRQLTAEDYQAKKLSRMVRRLQPGIVVNDRSLLPGDFYTAEQHPSPPADKSRPWEACMTMNKHWGHFPADKMWKTPAEIVNLLTGIASGGGNLLLNVGPRADGSIPRPNVRNLEQLGKWMATNGEAIYGAERCDIDAGTLGVFSQKGNVLYLMVHWWHGQRLVLPDFPYAIRSARILGSKHKICFTRDGKRLILHGLPARAPDPLCTVIAFRRGGKLGTRTPASKQAVVNFRER
jgi:alpha-L-fucosidase